MSQEKFKCHIQDCYTDWPHTHNSTNKPNIACKGEGATHFACDCFIEREIKLRQALEIAKEVLELTRMELKASFKTDSSESVKMNSEYALSHINELLGEEK